MTEASRNVLKWAEALQQQINLSRMTFQDRHDAVYDTSKVVEETSSAGPIAALNICMQIEMEFPGKVEEIVERAVESKLGTLSGLIMIVSAYRASS